VIEGTGPRYCPSIEDKVVRFAAKESHQIFVEPEGLSTTEVYPNGISTSLPFDLQLALVRSIRGFEHAHITRPGYAIEYDYFDPRDLLHSLETKAIAGLFFAGQINGTTGYEEAAAQGLVAGINAARKVAGLRSWSPGRDEAYIGVLIDDLISRGTSEPYRMFTSRAEFRLVLREDNADLRLTEQGHRLGVVGVQRFERFEKKKAEIERLRAALARAKLVAGDARAVALEARTGVRIARDTDLLQLLKRPEISIDALVVAWPALAGEFDAAVRAQVETQLKYDGYVARQEAEIERLKRHESIRLPDAIDYQSIDGLSAELKQKLGAARPDTLARAARIPGVTPAALSLLLVHARRARESVRA
jgi:tRNA uridine 5-carboxymethylaminomethyl modification enzyme